MKQPFVATLAIWALAASSFIALEAQAGTVTTSTADVTLTGWAYGSGNEVRTTMPTGSYAGGAGAFGGSLSGGTGFDTDAFVTYCVEMEESFYFGSVPMTGYRIVEGSRYFQDSRGNGGIAERLGLLMTYASSGAGRVADAASSTALQLAIWNTIYDTDDSLINSGSFRDDSTFRGAATSLLAGARGVATSSYDVFALQRSGSQDFLLLAPRVETVPEPGSLALAGTAVAALAWVGRRRKR